MTIFSPQILARRRKITAVVTGSVNYDFTTGSLPGGVTLTRASSGTRINSSGTLVLETTDVARFDYSPVSVGTSLGLLVEAASTNLLIRSAEIGNAAWNTANLGVTSDVATSPDGTVDADKIAEDNNSSTHQAYQNFASFVTSTVYVLSGYFKSVERTRSTIRFGDSLNKNAWFNLGGVAVGTIDSGVTATITDGGGGWYRCTSSISAGATGTNGCSFEPAQTDGVRSYAGTTGSGVNLFGAQLEAAAVASTYIPTTSATATRAADACSFTIPAGVFALRYTFDNSATQDIVASPGAYTIPTNLNRSRIKTIVSIAALNGSESDGTNVFTQTDSTLQILQVTRTLNATTAPDGTNNAILITETATTNRHIAYQDSVAAAANKTRTMSIYAKSNGRRYLMMQMDGTKCMFDLQAGAITDSLLNGTSSASANTIQAGMNGFYKCTMQFFDSVVNGGFADYCLSDRSTVAGTDVSNDPSYAGDGSSGIYLWRTKLVVT